MAARAGDGCIRRGRVGADQCDIETGETVWEQPIGRASGRGVLASDVIYLPTEEGLQAFATETGQRIAIDQPAEAKPLGNLLSWKAALYSVSLLEVRKYPDLTRGYEQALAAFQEERTDMTNAIRLAWLELLKERPDKALAALSQVPESWRERDARQYAHLQHLRVHALLEMAEAEGTSPAQVLELLKQARDIAESSEDVINISLKLGDFYRDTNREAEACDAYLSLVLSDMGDVLIDVGNGLEKRARGEAMRRLADTLDRMPDSDRQALIDRAESWLANKVGEEAFALLSRLTEFDALGSLASKADLLLGQWASRELQFEQAEGRFLSVIRQSDSPTLIAEATARLAAIYLEPDELHQPVSALKLIDPLEHEYGAIELPADVLDNDAPIAVSASGQKISATKVAAALRDRLDPEIFARHQLAMTPIVLGPPQEPSIRHQDNARPLTVRGDRKEAMTENLIRLREGKTLEVRSVDQNTIRWSTELRLLGEEAIGTMQTGVMFGQPQRFVRYPFDFARVGRAALDGQTLVVNTGYGLHAVGLLTGRRLWSRRYWPPHASSQASDMSASDACLWAHDGYVVTVDARGGIEVAPLDEGGRILWRAKNPKRKWHFVRARGDTVIVADKTLEHIDVYRLSDGQYLGQCTFTQSIGRQISISLFDEVICGPTSDNKIIAVDLKAPGVERWQTVMPRALSQVFKPTPNLLAVADRSGNVRIIDPSSGRQIVESHVEPCAAGVINGVMREDRLYVFGYKKRAMDPAKTVADQDVAVAAIDPKSGDLIWGRSGLSSWTYVSSTVLKASANAILLVALEPPEQEQRNRGLRYHTGQPARLRMKLIDKQNGKFIGETVSVTLNESPMTRRILDVQAWPGRVIVRAGSLQVEFPCPVEEGQRAHRAPISKGDGPPDRAQVSKGDDDRI